MHLIPPDDAVPLVITGRSPREAHRGRVEDHRRQVTGLSWDCGISQGSVEDQVEVRRGHGVSEGHADQQTSQLG